MKFIKIAKKSETSSHLIYSLKAKEVQSFLELRMGMYDHWQLAHVIERVFGSTEECTLSRKHYTVSQNTN